MGRDILVDGYNVIKTGASFQSAARQSLAAARDVLVAQLVNRYRHTPHQVIVVFDGDGAREQVMHDRCVRIIYSRSGETADMIIARLAGEARAAGREVEMYSSDGQVRQEVARQGGDARTADRLTEQLYAAPRDVARRIRRRQAVRRKYQLDPMYKANDEDEQEPRRPSFGKKKGPSHRGKPYF